MQSQRYTNSVSDLYLTDEVELLLEEIRELEPTNYCAEDIQDFEIAGSQTGGCGGGRSPVGTEHSWDSHAHYRRPPPLPPPSIAPIYCHWRSLISVTGILRTTLILTSLTICIIIWSVVGLKPWLLPLSSRIRMLLMAAVSSLMVHTLLLFMHLTRLVQLFPFHWNKVTVWACAWSACMFVIGGSYVIHAILAADEYIWAPLYIYNSMLAASGLAMCGFILSLGLACAVWSRTNKHGRPSIVRATYRALPARIDPQPGPSTQDPL